MAEGDGCPKWGDLLFENGEESYGNFLMGVKESSPPGISGTAVMALGLTKRVITVRGILTTDPSKSLAEKQGEHEAACETLGLDKYTTGNGRVFEKVRYVTVVWGRIFGNAVSGGSDAEYTSVLEQIIPPEPVG